MKKVILLVLVALMMVGCSEESRQRYFIYGNSKWDILKMNDSTYLMIPKYEKYSTPYVLNIKDKDNYHFCKERRQKELKDIVKQLKEN